MQDDDITNEALFQFVESGERDNSSMTLVKDLKTVIPSLPNRALFYEICNDFADNDGGGCTIVSSTLRDIYKSYRVRFKVRKSLMEDNNPLIISGLIEVSGDREDLSLATTGQKLFLG